MYLTDAFVLVIYFCQIKALRRSRVSHLVTLTEKYNPALSCFFWKKISPLFHIQYCRPFRPAPCSATANKMSTARYTCQARDCDRTFSKLDDFLVHVKNHSPSAFKAASKKHQWKQQPGSSDQKSSGSEKNPFACTTPGCNYSGKRARNLERHVASYHAGRRRPPTKRNAGLTFECQKCEKKFKTSYVRDLHFRRQHGESVREFYRDRKRRLAEERLKKQSELEQKLQRLDEEKKQLALAHEKIDERMEERRG